MVVWKKFLTFAFRHGSTSKTNNMDIKTLTEAEQAMCKRYIDLGNNVDFIRKGIAFCHGNPSHGVLLTGINPSGNGGANVFYTFRGAKDDPPSRYWEHKKKQIVGKIEELIDKTAYLDLFPYFESSQDTIEETIRPHIEFQVKVLEITQTIMSERTVLNQIFCQKCAFFTIIKVASVLLCTPSALRAITWKV